MQNNDKINEIIEKLKTLTLFEISILIKKIENTFELEILSTSSIQNSVEVNTNIIEVEEINKIEEKVLFDVILKEVLPDKKIPVLKMVKSLTGLNLRESKEFVDNLPRILKEGINKEDCEKIKKEIEELGGIIEIK